MQAEVVVSLPLERGVEVAFDGPLEVSLDCGFCQRTRRTITFTPDAPEACCAPGSARRPGVAHPPFPGRIVGLEVSRDARVVTATWRLEYDASPFEDRRYGPELRPWTGRPCWARAPMTLWCPCGASTAARAQSNRARPWSLHCGCGRLLFTERRESPVLRWLDPDRRRWRQAPERYGPIPRARV